jgi:hypothetical protein
MKVATSQSLRVKFDLVWMPRYVLCAVGVQWAVVEQCMDKKSPDFGKWSCLVGGAYATNGDDSRYCFETHKAAIEHAEKVVRGLK